MASGNADFLQGYMPQRAAAPTMPTMPEMPMMAHAPAAPAPAPRVDPRTAEPIAEYESTEFERIHGRTPTYQERVMIRAVPAITQQLGRPPSRVELLQYISRRETTVHGAQQPQFEVIHDDAAAQPVSQPGGGTPA